MQPSIWQKCVARLEVELTTQQFNTWVLPLHAVEENTSIQLLAPNKFVQEWVNDKLILRINEIAESISEGNAPQVRVTIGSKNTTEIQPRHAPAVEQKSFFQRKNDLPNTKYVSNINKAYTFDSFVEGNSNQLAKAASLQVAENAGSAYNPLFIYGGVGLGKTHLMHSVGNQILKNNPNGRVIYLHSERFVQDMVKALQHNAIDEFRSEEHTSELQSH